MVVSHQPGLRGRTVDQAAARGRTLSRAQRLAARAQRRGRAMDLASSPLARSPRIAAPTRDRDEQRGEQEEELAWRRETGQVSARALSGRAAASSSVASAV